MENSCSENNCISYLSGGLFGDFIHQLSVVKEKYLETGKKGILYISNDGEAFRLGLESTYQMTSHLIKSQDYIENYKIYNGEHYDINLCSWRKNWFLYHADWYIIFRDQYKLHWGTHQWLNVTKNETWKNKIVINEPTYRFSNINYQNLYEIYGNQLVFVAFREPNYKDYEIFVQKTGLNIEYYDPITMDELASVIHSCKLFVGAPSGIMAIAFAVKAQILIGRPPCDSEYVMFRTLDHHFSNITIYNDETPSTISEV